MTTAVPLHDPQQIIREAISRVAAIATLPEITSRIVALVDDPRSSAAQLHKIVAHDPALVSRVLKVVNSAFYGLPGQIGTVDRAIVLLGLNAVKSIAVAASIGQLFRAVRLCEGYTARDLWTHCVSVAITARELARQLRLPIAEEAFLAGMIHDLGILVELQLWPDTLHDICQSARTDASRPFHRIEEERLGVDHQKLGSAIIERWKFPRTCQLVAGHHHDPASLADDNRMLVTLVFAADTLCARAGQGFPLTARGQDLLAARLDGVGLDPAAVERIFESIAPTLGGAAALLG